MSSEPRNNERNVERSDKVQNLQKQVASLKRRLHSPKTDLLVNGNLYIVRMELPVRDFNWELKDDQILLVSFDRQPDFLSDVTTIYSETKYGKNMRRVKLPGKVHSQPIRNDCENGIWIVEFSALQEQDQDQEMKDKLETIPEDSPLSDCQNVKASWADM